MPRLEDILKDVDKKKLLMKKEQLNFSGKKEKANNFNGYVGQTPNLNSSLGINSADGDPTNTGIAGNVVAPAPTSSKLDTFFQKNSNIITGLGGSILGALTGSTGNSSPAVDNGYVAPPPIQPSKKILGMPAGLFWVLVIVTVIVIGIVVYKKMKK